MHILLDLFLTFFKIGIVSFGGGYAMIPLITDECSKWLAHEQILNFIAVSESTPGPIAINMATFIGASQGGFLGAVLATLGVVLPSFIIVLLLCKVYEKWKEHYMFKGVMSGLKPATLGLIGTAALSLATPENFIDWKSFVICIVAFVALYFKKVGPFSIIALGALVGLLIY